MKMRAVVVKLVTKFSACYEQVLAQMTSKGHVVLVNVNRRTGSIFSRALGHC